MPCFHPLQAYFSVRPDGKKDVKFSKVLGKMFQEGLTLPEGSISLPCGQCMGCRLERSRQWAVRMLHESKLYEDNCFVTLTFDDDNLVKMCPGGSLVRKHVQDFMKRLRQKFSDRVIRVFYCGEYGDMFSRPHYHLCLFNCDFSDRVSWRRVDGFQYYNSEILDFLWGFGHAVVTSFSFDTAAYVARYCVKKITGTKAVEHYAGRLPEFCGMSLKPGIGRGFIDKFGSSDVYPYDECIVNGMRSKPPRYYDKVLGELDPERLELSKANRVELAQDRAHDNTFRRLLVREKCQEARFKKLVRTLECS